MQNCFFYLLNLCAFDVPVAVAVEAPGLFESKHFERFPKLMQRLKVSLRFHPMSALHLGQYILKLSRLFFILLNQKEC